MTKEKALVWGENLSKSNKGDFMVVCHKEYLTA